jgi:hypothetical protein
MTYLIQYIQQILSWLLTFIDWICTEVFSVVMGALLAILNAIPVPSFFTNASTELAGLPAGVLYFAQAADLSTGCSVVISAWLLRFLIRRIPIIG